MELDEHGFLEELLALRREPWETSSSAFPTAAMGDFFPVEGGSCLDCCFDEAQPVGREGGGCPDLPNYLTAASFGFLGAPAPSDIACGCFNSATYFPPPPPPPPFHLDLVQSFSPTTTASTAGTPPGASAAPSSSPEGCCRSALEGENRGRLARNHRHGTGSSSGEPAAAREEGGVICKVEEPSYPCVDVGGGVAGKTVVDHFPLLGRSPSFSSACLPEKKNRSKKVEGQPSKNLMAERRRRKRLNDRLAMLRSVVPKISKMDRTSILGDTIDYMKELLEKIKLLREEIESAAAGGGCSSSDEASAAPLLNFPKDSHLNPPEDALVRTNTPKFNVERRELSTRVEICCAAKPGLLLSTVNTMEALGLEIQRCVVSCFNDFGMQASCSEDANQRALISAEEIKQALFRNAGYGGRCA